MRASAVGEVSKTYARAGGRSSSRLTSKPVWTVPPRSRRYAASASEIDCEPPRGRGQPFACAARAKTRPTAPVAIPSSGAMACATSPANSARARSSWKRRMSHVEGAAR